MAQSFVRTNKVWLRTDTEDQILAEYNLTIVRANLGTAYQSWYDGAINPEMTWAQIDSVAWDMVKTLAKDAEQRDYNDTQRDTASWARGG